jgi:GntR family transcriptional regulator
MMEFKSPKGIFQQIADSLCDRILSGELKEGDKVPSVRDQAAGLGVNHNTIMRSYMELQRDEIITNQRGVGYYVAEGAVSKIMDLRKQEFFEQMVPEFVHQVDVLKVTKSELGFLIEKLENNETSIQNN